MILRRNTKKKFWMAKMPIELKQELDRIRIERIKRGKDMEQKSYTRLGKAIVRYKPLWKILEEADLKEEEAYG